jgi:hypothetical protein
MDVRFGGGRDEEILKLEARFDTIKKEQAKIDAMLAQLTSGGNATLVLAKAVIDQNLTVSSELDARIDELRLVVDHEKTQRFCQAVMTPSSPK